MIERILLMMFTLPAHDELGTCRACLVYAHEMEAFSLEQLLMQGRVVLHHLADPLQQVGHHGQPSLLPAVQGPRQSLHVLREQRLFTQSVILSYRGHSHQAHNL